MYIPLSIPPIPLPQYIQLDRDSQWHTSALLSLPLESLTIPSRLRPDQETCVSFNEMEALLNVNGNQRIASLKCSIIETTETSSTKIDERMPRSNTRDELHGQETTARSDVDLSCGEARPTASGHNQHGAIEHVFASVESLRDQKQQILMTNNADEDESSRKRRRLAGLPITHWFVPSDSVNFCGLLITARNSK